MSNPFKQMRGISDKDLSQLLAQHAGGLNAMLRWVAVVESERQLVRRYRWVGLLWAIAVSGAIIRLLVTR